MTETFLPLTPVVALVLFAVWGLLLVMCVGTWRLGLALSGKTPKGGFTAGAPHGSDTYWRLNRAHLNVAENLPFFGAIVLGGAVLGEQSPLFQQLANVVLFARIVQTVIHVASGAQAAILLRFLAYLVQVFSMLFMASIVLQSAGFKLPA